MIEALQFEFMQNALLAGILVSIASGIIGSLIVVNRMVFLAGGIAHTSYGGIGLAIFFGLPIFFGASLFAVFAAIFIAQVTLKNKNRIDTIIGLLWSIGMAIGVIFVDITPGYNVDLMSYLFGSILAVTSEDIYFMVGLLVIIFAIISVWYRDILAVSYDIEYSKLIGININLFYTIILVLSALTIVISIKVVGLILVIAMMTIPVYIAEYFSESLWGMMSVSALVATIFTVVGLYISYTYNITSGAAIIMTAAVSLTLFLTIRKLRNV